MTAARSRGLAVAAAAALATACASAPRDVVRIDVPERAARGPRAVPVGTELTIALGDTLDTRTSVEGQAFRATLLTNLTTADGSILVRAGTPLHGLVTRVRSGDDPLLALELPGLETTEGPAPLAAKLKDADSATEDDVVLTRGERAGAAAYAGTDPAYDPTTSAIRLEAGSRLRLELTRPLVALP